MSDSIPGVRGISSATTSESPKPRPAPDESIPPVANADVERVANSEIATNADVISFLNFIFSLPLEENKKEPPQRFLYN